MSPEAERGEGQHLACDNGHDPLDNPAANQSHDCDNPEVETSLAVENNHNDGGSSLAGAIFNFTNCIVGAGAIGLGGAMARSGGAISVLSILGFAFLTKRSLDLVIRLSLEQAPPSHSTGGSYSISYEDLGQVAFGTIGRWIIAASKFLYSFGCLVAYVVVVKDNLAAATLNLMQHTCHHNHESTAGDNVIWTATLRSMLSSLCAILGNRIETTWLVCIAIIFPLCLWRDMRPLASLSALSVASIVSIMVIILYLYLVDPNHEIQQQNESAAAARHHGDPTIDDDKVMGGGMYETWLEIRPGYIECMGTFVFTFVSQHTVHLVFQSLKAELRTARHWNWVSLWAVLISAILSLAIGMGVYMSFGLNAESDIFEIYPQTPLIDVAKLMLSITMILTFPLPFFTCRELLIITFFPSPSSLGGNNQGNDMDTSLEFSPERRRDESQGVDNGQGEGSDLEQPLLVERRYSGVTSSTSDLISTSVQAVAASALGYALLEDDPRQLKLPFHIAMTFKLWLVVVSLAIAAPSLGDVLDLVGCASGTMIAFIVPSCISFRLKGYSLEAAILLLVGGVVGTVGTLFSVRQILTDMRIV